MAHRQAADDTAEVTAAVVGWYRGELAEPARFPWSGSRASWREKPGSPLVLPVPELIGPSWQTREGRWLLPEYSLGWGMLGWYGTWLQLSPGVAWRHTLEQARWTLWWYAVDGRGRFTHRDAVLQRLKGWGKDPLAAALCAGEMLGPCRFAGWDADGQPIGEPHPQPWVQTAATSLEQTKNTMLLFQYLFTPAAVAKWRLQVLKEKVHGAGGALIEAVTSSPATLEGARSTFVLMNETQHWNASNSGHDMADVIERNVTKSPDGAARTLAITNAPMPGEDSVAERTRDAWELAQSGKAADVGLMYDSVEPPAGAPLPEVGNEQAEEFAREVIRAVRGDSTWLDVDRILQSMQDVRNAPSRSRRFWYNELHSPEDAWCARAEWEACKVEGLELADGDWIVLFGDGSKSDDATALVGCRMDDGAVFLLGCWQRPQHAKDWRVDRAEVDGAVTDAHGRFRVCGFFWDPAPGTDEETGDRYWDDLVTEWALRWGETYFTRASDKHAVSWPMDKNHPANVRDFTVAAGQGRADVTRRDLPHDGKRLLRIHVCNMRRRLNKWGVSVGKEHRESSAKIDAGVCVIGARMLRRRVQLSKEWMRELRKARGQGRVVVFR